jgi:hypothetical protein
MIYSLAITATVALILLFLLAGGFVYVRRAVGAAAEGRAPFGRWRWYPSPLGLLLLVPLAALLFFRFFPVVLLIPIILPFLRRGARGPLSFLWNAGRPAPPQSRTRDGDDGETEGEYRPLDDA